MSTDQRISRIKQVVEKRQSGLIVVCEDVHDPHNIQAVARTCDAFGIQEMYLVFEKQQPFNPKKIGKATSASANKWLDYKTFRSTQACYQTLKKQKFTIYAAALADQAISFYQADFLKEKIALVFGNEHAGLSPDAISGADCVITIPMHGFVESLNISVAAGVVISEVTRQRQQNSGKFVYPTKQQQELLTAFLEK